MNEETTAKLKALFEAMKRDEALVLDALASEVEQRSKKVLSDICEHVKLASDDFETSSPQETKWRLSKILELIRGGR